MAEQNKGGGSEKPPKPVLPNPPKPKPTTIRGDKVIKVQSRDSGNGGKK